MSVFGSGIRPWKRQTETKRAEDSSVPGKGELVVSDAGKVYAGDGATQAKNLPPMLRKTDADATYATTSQGAKADSAVQPAALSSGLAGKANTTHAHTPGDITALTEYIQDAVNDLIQAGANVTKTYDDANNTLTISATGGGGTTTDAEVVRDTIAGALVASTGINIAVDDPGDTITISVAGIPASAITTGTLPITRGGTGGTDAASARAALGAGTSSLTLGTTSSTAAAGNDSRLSDTRTPTDNSVSSAKIVDGAVTPQKLGGTIPVTLGGTGANTITGIVKGTGTTAMVAATADSDYVTPSGAGTLSNKRIVPRVGTVASSATPTINTDQVEEYTITALAAAITSWTISGTPADGQPLILRILDNGTARAITWPASFRVVGVTLPTTTTVSKTLYVGALYNSAAAKWDVLAVAQEA